MVARQCSAYVNEEPEARGENAIGVYGGVYSDDGPRVDRDEVGTVARYSNVCAIGALCSMHAVRGQLSSTSLTCFGMCR